MRCTGWAAGLTDTRSACLGLLTLSFLTPSITTAVITNGYGRLNCNSWMTSTKLFTTHHPFLYTHWVVGSEISTYIHHPEIYCIYIGGSGRWKKDDFSMNPLGMFRVDARAAVKIPDLQRGRALVFVNSLECGYYMFLSLRSYEYLKRLFYPMVRKNASDAFFCWLSWEV